MRTISCISSLLINHLDRGPSSLYIPPLSLVSLQELQAFIMLQVVFYETYPLPRNLFFDLFVFVLLPQLIPLQFLPQVLEVIVVVLEHVII
jgi:hypothetical protein